MRSILTIWKKELKDTIRDRRTLVSSVLLPMLLMPAIIIGMGKLTKAQIEGLQEKAVIIGVTNAHASASFLTVVQAQPNVTVKEIGEDAQDLVRERKVDVALLLPASLQTQIDVHAPVNIEVLQNSLNDTSSVATGRIANAIAQFNEALFLVRLSESGIDQTIRNGLTLLPKETATGQELGGFGLGFLLPLFIILWASVGGQYTAVDVSAGEKERKTLESLLLTPVRRLHVVFGKFLAVATTSLLSVVIALTSLYAVFIFGGKDLFLSGSGVPGATSSLDFSLEPLAIAVMFGVSILLVAFFSALNLSVAIFAKSYKEAQSYIGPSYLVVILPVVAFNAIPGFAPSTGFFAIPIVNAVLLFKEVLVGIYNPLHLLLTVAVLLVIALAMVVVTGKIYQREGILFKE